jgi:hypothetical protein
MALEEVMLIDTGEDLRDSLHSLAAVLVAGVSVDPYGVRAHECVSGPTQRLERLAVVVAVVTVIQRIPSVARSLRGLESTRRSRSRSVLEAKRGQR